MSMVESGHGNREFALNVCLTNRPGNRSTDWLMGSFGSILGTTDFRVYALWCLSYKNLQINELSKFKNFISLLHCLQVAMIKSRCLNINFETWVYVFPWAVSVTLGPMRAQGAQAQSSSWLIPTHTEISLFQHRGINLSQSAYSDTVGLAYS